MSDAVLRVLALCAQDVYSARPTNDSLNRIHYFENDTDAEAAIYDLNGVPVVAFRGTEPTEAKDVLADFRLSPTAPWMGSGLRVHSGISRHVTALWDIITAHLVERNGSIYITGHSLGGGMAVLFALRLLHAYPNFDRVIVITFGQPRVLYSRMPRSPRLVYLRIVDHQDPVPQLPPRICGFRHGGVKLPIGPRRSVLRHMRFCCPYSIFDHSMTNYVDALSHSIPQLHLNVVATRGLLG